MTFFQSSCLFPKLTKLPQTIAASVIKSTQVLFQAMCLLNIGRIGKAPVFYHVLLMAEKTIVL